MGFEPTRGDPIGLAGRRLNRSAKASLLNTIKHHTDGRPDAYTATGSARKEIGHDKHTPQVLFQNNYNLPASFSRFFQCVNDLHGVVKWPLFVLEVRNILENNTSSYEIKLRYSLAG